MQTRPHPLPIGAAALFALTLLLSAPAQASVSEAMGPLVFELLDGGMLCAGVAEVAEADFSYSCALEGPDNGLGGLACVEVLDERCAPDIEAAAGATLLGTADSTLAGSDIAGVGDVNGDGFDDLLIAATNIASGTGDVASAHLVLGPVIGEVSLADSAASFTLDATSTTTEAIAVSGAGDVDGDGYPDLIIGSQEDESAASEAGAAFLLLSSSRPTFRGELTTADADATLLGEARDWAGGAVAGAGDIDGDGYGDLLIGAHRAGINGAAYLISGPVTGALSLGDVETRFVGEHAGSEAGGAVASAGDVDGDGNADLLIGAPAAELGGSKVGSTEAGAVYLILGPVSGEVDLASADAKLSAESTSDEAGESLDGPGDIDGDGYDDLLIGAPLYSGDSAATASQGAAYLVSGPISGDLSLSDADARYLGEREYSLVGEDVAGAGDTDGDGLPELLLSSANCSLTDGGCLYLIREPAEGTTTLSGAERILRGDLEHPVAGAGDVDGDGLDDLLSGSYGYYGPDSTQIGAAFLIYGRSL